MRKAISNGHDIVPKIWVQWPTQYSLDVDTSNISFSIRIIDFSYYIH